MRLTTKVVLAPALTLACVTGLAGPVQARPAKSVIVVDTAWAEGTGVKVDGHVTSPKHACEAGRKVKVYHDVAPRGPGSEDFLLSARDGELYMAQDRTLHVWARRPGAWRLVANWSEALPGPVTRLAMSPRGDLLAIVVAESMPEPEPAG